MIKKQKLKHIIASAVLLTGLFAIFTPNTAYAEDCVDGELKSIPCPSDMSQCSPSSDIWLPESERSQPEPSCYITPDWMSDLQSEDPDSNTGPTDCETNILTNIKCNDSDTLEDGPIWAILLMVINILTAGIGILAVGGVVYASIRYATAGGNTEQTKQAMKLLGNITIGVIAYALMYAFLNFLIPGGLFAAP